MTFKYSLLFNYIQVNAGALIIAVWLVMRVGLDTKYFGRSINDLSQSKMQISRAVLPVTKGLST